MFLPIILYSYDVPFERNPALSSIENSLEDKILDPQPKRKPATRIDWETVPSAWPKAPRRSRGRRTRLAGGPHLEAPAAQPAVPALPDPGDRAPAAHRPAPDQCPGRRRAVSRLLQPDSMDGATLQALLGQASGGAGDVVRLLGETGGAPPNMALRARVRAERQKMDAIVDRCHAEVSARFPGLLPPRRAATAAPAAGSGEPPRTAPDSAGLQRTVADSGGP